MFKCSKCKQLKEAHDFSPDKRTKNGLTGWCKVCRRKPKKIKPIYIPPEKKVCPKCKILKPLNKFYSHKGTKDKVACHCIQCHKEYSSYRIKNKIGCYGSVEKRERDRIYGMKRRQQNREKIIKYYSNGNMCCNYCGFKDIRALSVDHINGDGFEHRRELAKNGVLSKDFYKWIIKHNFPEGFQILCMNCQWIKRYTNHEYKNGHSHKFKNQ